MNLELTPSVLLSQLQLLLSKLASVENTPANILVAYSGGLDSHVLLHLLSRISNTEFNLRAIYINHGLQIEGNQWASHCKNICTDLNVDYRSIDLNLEVPKGESTEDIARKARYQALSENLLDDEILVTAHHQNDQAETLLLQLFRGAGVQGLASMPEVSELKGQNNTHFRPLLHYSRESLETYAKTHQLKHIEDPSNKDTAFDRNFLRQDIMPVLRKRWLGIDKTISRAASIQAETKTLLDEFAAVELPNVLSKEVYYSLDDNELSLAPINLTELQKYSLSKQRLLIRYWISQQGYINPSDKKLSHIFTNLIDADADKQPLIEWQSVELRRYQQSLYLMTPLSTHDASQIHAWDLHQSLSIDSLGLSLSPDVLPVEIPKANTEIIVRFRQGGEKIEIPKRGNIILKNLFQELQVPPWIRSRLPLIYQNDKLIKIVGLNKAKRYPLNLHSPNSHPPTF